MPRIQDPSIPVQKGFYDRFHPKMDEQVAHCLTTDAMVMLHPRLARKNPAALITAMMVHRLNFYSYTFAGLSLLIMGKDVQTKSEISTLRNRLIGRSFKPERYWLHHVTQCPRCLLILASENENHVFTYGLLAIRDDKNRYQTHLAYILQLSVEVKGDQISIISKNGVDIGSAYFHWVGIRNQGKMLRRYTGKDLINKTKKDFETLTDDYVMYLNDKLDEIRKNKWHLTMDDEALNMKNTIRDREMDQDDQDEIEIIAKSERDENTSESSDDEDAEIIVPVKKYQKPIK